MAKKKQPNIIVIFCDDLGYGDLGCYGSEVNRTPRLDQMAAEGMRFTDFYVACSVCSPSRAALMTGCYPRRVGLEKGESFKVLRPVDPIGLNPEEMSMATMLKKQGYRTGMVGKWHLGDQEPFLPTNHGFDSYFGLPYSNDMNRMGKPDYELGMTFPLLPLMSQDKVIAMDPNQASLTEIYTEKARRFIHESKDGPFFLYFSHMYVHTPIYTPMDFLYKSNNGPYGAAVEHIDHCTGVLLDTLKELGLAEDTLIVFSSDNGSNGNDGGSNAPLRGRKGTGWEGGFREPGIMYWPGTIKAGSTCERLTTTMDLLPTFATLAGAELPADRKLDGLDISPVLRGKPEQAEECEKFFYYMEDNLHAVRSGNWKLILDGSDELYDLENDVGESENVFAKHPDVVAKLSAYADECREDLGDASKDMPGKNCRPVGRVENPVPLLPLDTVHPYLRAEYDLDDKEAGDR